MSAPSPRPVPILNDLLMHLLLPGQAFVRLGRPLPRWGWTLAGLLAMNLISFQVFVVGDRRWLALWPLLAGLAAWHFVKVARTTGVRRPLRGELLYTLAAMAAWLTPILLDPLPGDHVSTTQRRETALARQIHLNAAVAVAEGQTLSNGPCPPSLIPESGLAVQGCELHLTDPLSPDVQVTFSSGRTVSLP